MKEVLEAKDRTKARKDCSTEMDLCYTVWNIRGCYGGICTFTLT